MALALLGFSVIRPSAVRPSAVYYDILAGPLKNFLIPKMRMLDFSICNNMTP